MSRSAGPARSLRGSAACIGRFAPSPTGPLHAGSLVAALASAMDVWSRDGRWRLRIDDIDPARERPGSAASFSTTLVAHGLVPDDSTLYQSGHLGRYRAALQALADTGLIYPCRCSRKQLAGAMLYPGYCRPGTPAECRALAQAHLQRWPTVPNPTVPIDEQADAYCWRLHLIGQQGFTDAIQGPCDGLLEKTTGDTVIWRRDDMPAYHLACAMDDAQPHITHVLRGADLLASTRVHRAIHSRLGLASPGYAHVPVATGRGGQKLSKQTAASALPCDKALASLHNVWKFLGQPALPPTRSPTDFVRHARSHWRREWVPPVRERPWRR